MNGSGYINKRKKLIIVNKQQKGFKFGKHDILVYIGGIHPDYINKECKIVSRSKAKGQETCKVRFIDNVELTIPVVVLRKKNEQLTLEI